MQARLETVPAPRRRIRDPDKEPSMNKTVILVDDAAHTRARLAALLDAQALPLRVGPGELVLVGCAPRMTHRVSKWVSHGAREHWRTKWARKLFDELEPWLQAQGLPAQCVLAKGPLEELLAELRADAVIDARRPKAPTPAEAARELSARPAWRSAMVIFGLGALVALAEA
jgi:hypothetical protein